MKANTTGEELIKKLPGEKNPELSKTYGKFN
jgi:hypothetical protein